MRSLPRLARRVAAVSAVAALLGAVSVLTTADDRGRVIAADVLGAGGEFHPLEPARVLDTRSGVNIEAGARPLTAGAGDTFELSLSGLGGLPDMSAPADDGDDGENDENGENGDENGENGENGEQGSAGGSGDHPVLAVALSITVVEPTVPGFLSAYATDPDAGAGEAASSIVNFSTGETVPNMTVLAPSADGTLTIQLVSADPSGAAGTAHVLVDVFGWFSKGTHAENGSRLIPVGPGRIFDSRNPAFGSTPVGPGGSVRVPIAGADSLNPQVTGIVPDREGITGALVNVTGVNQDSSSEATFVSVVPEPPADGVPPSTSNLNLRRDQVKANLVMVPVGPDGSIWLYNSAGEVHLVVDVVAYLEPRPSDTREGRVIPLRQPLRVIDTRQADFRELRLGPSQAEDWSFGCFAADVTIGEEWVGPQSAFLGNLTGTGLQRHAEWPDWSPIDSYLTVFPSSPDQGPPPEASNVNVGENESVPNAALFRYGAAEVGDDLEPNSVRVFNHNGEIHYLVDAAAVVLTDGDDTRETLCPGG